MHTLLPPDLYVVQSLPKRLVLFTGTPSPGALPYMTLLGPHRSPLS